MKVSNTVEISVRKKVKRLELFSCLKALDSAVLPSASRTCGSFVSGPDCCILKINMQIKVSAIEIRALLRNRFE